MLTRQRIHKGLIGVFLAGVVAGLGGAGARADPPRTQAEREAVWDKMEAKEQWSVIAFALATSPDDAFFSEKLEELARRGHAEAQYAMGLRAVHGEGGTAKDLRAAFQWFLKAAEGGYADAQYNVAVMYINGLGGTKDIEAASKWMKRAAVGGNEEAQALVEGYAAEQRKVR